jgi:hypothetical protein
MPRAFCLLNHALTERQKAELAADFACNHIVYPPEDLSARWSGVSTEKELTPAQLRPFADWFAGAGAGDAAVIQGEAGSSFALVDFALQRGLIPLHAVTRRKTTEIREGEKILKKQEFEHVCFRRYRYFREL